VTVGAGGRTIDAIAKSDTGARRTSIDLDVAADIGAGPIVGTVHVKSGSQTGRQKRPLVEIDVKIGDRWQTVTASIENRNHMAYPYRLVGHSRRLPRGRHETATGGVRATSPEPFASL